MTRERNSQNVTLRQYLLGSTPDGERERLEEALLADDGLYEELLATEEELIDEYVWGRLTESERVQFDRYLNTLPDSERRLGFASALRARLLAPRPESEAANRATHFASQDRSFPPRAFLISAAAILLTILGGIWSLATISRLREDVESAQAEIARLQEQQNTHSVGATTDLVTASAAPAATRSILLAPGLLRSGGSAQVVTIPGEPELLEFQLDLGANSHDNYRAVVYDANSSEVASLDQLRARETVDRILVVFRASTDWFSPGDYYVTLMGDVEHGAPAPVARYNFRVSKE